MRKIVNIICVGLGLLFAGIGVAGIVLPVLPTTPFFLLAAFLFAKGSERFHSWFIETSLYQKYIVQAIHKKEMTSKEKRRAMVFLGILFSFSFIVCPIWYIKLLVLTIAIGHLFYFTCKVKTVAPKEAIES